MAENKEYITQQESAGAIQISEDVVASIATAAALETEGVSAMLGAPAVISSPPGRWRPRASSLNLRKAACPSRCTS